MSSLQTIVKKLSTAQKLPDWSLPYVSDEYGTSNCNYWDQNPSPNAMRKNADNGPVSWHWTWLQRSEHKHSWHYCWTNLKSYFLFVIGSNNYLCNIKSAFGDRPLRSCGISFIIGNLTKELWQISCAKCYLTALYMLFQPLTGCQVVVKFKDFSIPLHSSTSIPSILPLTNFA